MAYSITLPETSRSYALETGTEETDEEPETANDEAGEVDELVALSDEPAAIAANREPQPSLTLTILCATGSSSDGCSESGGSIYGTSLATVNTTAYTGIYTVTVSATDVENYSLKIYSDSANGALTGTGQTGTIATGTADYAKDLAANTWGYIVVDGDTALADSKVEAMPASTGAAKEIAKKVGGTTEVTENPETVTSSTKLAFAAKFGDTAATGHYQSTVRLALTATPKQLIKGIQPNMYMQEITADMCKQTALNTEISVKDKRGDTPYKIVRIKNQAGDTSDDGANCWMAENLKLNLATYWNSTYMTTTYTDVPNNAYFSGIGSATPKNAGFSTSNSNNYQVIEYTNASPTVASGGAYSSTYGYYYTWCAATVGCKRGTTAGASLTSGDADASICPAGWKLPSGNTNGEWYNLLNGLNTSIVAAAPYKIPTAGSMGISGLDNASSNGSYWSRTASSGANNAHGMTFGSSFFYPGTAANYRYYGYSVRCVRLVN